MGGPHVDALKRLATTDTVKVIHPGLGECHLFTLICHTDIQWEDVQLRHVDAYTHTNTEAWAVFTPQTTASHPSKRDMRALITHSYTVYQ